jgi:hypothetical protein
VKPVLLDVNVLIALAWETAERHEEAQAWFERNRGRHYASCPITQAGFVRLSANGSLFPQPATPWSAVLLLETILANPLHVFWPDDIPMRQAMVRVGTPQGHKQVTDAYLIGLAGAHGGVLATFDRKAQQIAPGNVELIG